MKATTIDPPDVLRGPPDPTRHRDWLQAPNGRRIYPFDLRPEDFDIRVIARTLAGERRWRGFTREPYFVAQHLVLCSHIVEPEHALWAAVHDLPEWLVADLPAPIKHAPELAGYRALEDRIMRAACDWLNLPYDMPPSVKRADKVLGATEARDLFDELDPEWRERLEVAEMLAERIEPWGAWKAEWMFLERFRELTGGRFQ